MWVKCSHCRALARVGLGMENRFRFQNRILMPSSHCTILARFFTRRQVLINRRQMPEIGGKSVLVPASDNRAVWIIKDAIWGNRRHVADAREIFGMLNIWSCRRFSILLCEWVLTGSDWKIHRRWPTANERARYRAKQALEYTEQVTLGYMKMKGGFPVNNILL